MVSTLQSYIYEDLHPKIEKQDTPESKLLIVHIPDGFARGDIGAKVEVDFGRIRVFGERSIGSNKMLRFNEKYQVPSHCDIGNIKGKFDGKIVTITIPKIQGKIPEPEPEPEPEPTEENNNNVEEVNNQQNTFDQAPKSNVESKEDQTPQEAQNVTVPQKDQVTKVDNKGEVYNEAPTSQETTHEPISQKSEDEISQKESVTQKDQKDQEVSQKESIPHKGQEEISQKESLPQKDQEEISQKSQVTKVESKEKTFHETSTQPEGTYESMPQKSEDQGTVNKATDQDTKDAKLQTEENTSNPKDENKEEKKIAKEETKDYLKKTIEETKEESKGSVTEETLPPKKTFKEKGKDMINDKFGDDEKKSDKKGIHESTRTRIKDIALSTTQAVTNYAKRFSEEDKQKLIYTGATILVVALGVYASYKYRSSRRS
ncbi:unnamed protein product [Trifolium pratense]|uniref:Uncharacterized protein n=1 Tax=Trifolium pratense TaxID=57577 RepID=A0ACB0J0U0_TRIPR|nr:unnamed protein product [Trifolium pratense]